MLVDVILVVIGVCWVLAACFSDIRTREVPDWLNFSLISLGLGVRLVYSLVYSDWNFFLYGLMGFFAAFVFGMLFYYAHVWGGGDSKLLMGLGAVFATAPFFVSSKLPFFVVMLTNILVFGAIYGLMWALYLFVVNYKAVLVEAGKDFALSRQLRYSLMVFALALLLAAPFIRDFFIRVFVFIIALSLVAYYFLYVIVKAIEKVTMCKRVSVSQLVLGDWICENVRANGKIICGPKDYGLTLRQLNELRRNKIKHVFVKEGMAFVPAFVLGLLFSLIFGEIIFMLF